ncbi:MAG: DUF4431 domain-containing protein [Rhizobiales bacterium]|nr:DUF4431 domain-containing protein [Hyphomicrobiales bacterium]
MRAAIAASIFVLATPAFADECLKYDQPATLTGYVGDAVFPGQPNYADVKKGDAKETASLLFLASPICTDGDGDYDGVAVVPVVQLICPGLKSSAGSPVTVKGTVIPAQTAHHHAAVLLDCQ